MTGRQTTAASEIPGRVPAGNTGACAADLGGTAFLTIGPAVAGIAACKRMTDRTGAADMLISVVLPRPVGEGRAAAGRPSGEQGTGAVISGAAVTIGTAGVCGRTIVQMTGAAVGRRTGSHGIRAACGIGGMTAGASAPGAINGRFMRRSRIGEGMGAAGID